MKNLLLLVLLIAGAWYLFFEKAEPPPATEVEQAAPPPRADYSGVRTFYSTLNDPAVPADTHYTGSAVNLGNGSIGQPVSVAPGAVTAAPAAATPADRATSSIGLGGAGGR